MMTEETKDRIDNMSYARMLQLWRFSPPGTEFFTGETGTYFAEVFRKKRAELPEGEHSRISKELGW